MKLTILDVFFILQEYVNHGAVLYKVYVCGSRVWISSPRASIPDYVDYHPMNTATSRNTIVLDNGSLGSKKMRMGHVDQVPSSFTLFKSSDMKREIPTWPSSVPTHECSTTRLPQPPHDVIRKVRIQRPKVETIGTVADV